MEGGSLFVSSGILRLLNRVTGRGAVFSILIRNGEGLVTNKDETKITSYNYHYKGNI